jgi:hypothetical protein
MSLRGSIDNLDTELNETLNSVIEVMMSDADVYLNRFASQHFSVAKVIIIFFKN